MTASAPGQTRPSEHDEGSIIARVGTKAARALATAQNATHRVLCGRNGRQVEHHVNIAKFRAGGAAMVAASSRCLASFVSRRPSIGTLDRGMAPHLKNVDQAFPSPAVWQIQAHLRGMAEVRLAADPVFDRHHQLIDQSV